MWFIAETWLKWPCHFLLKPDYNDWVIFCWNLTNLSCHFLSCWYMTKSHVRSMSFLLKPDWNQHVSYCWNLAKMVVISFRKTWLNINEHGMINFMLSWVEHDIVLKPRGQASSVPLWAVSVVYDTYFLLSVHLFSSSVLQIISVLFQQQFIWSFFVRY